jgi:hypothetical protein
VEDGAQQGVQAHQKGRTDSVGQSRVSGQSHQSVCCSSVASCCRGGPSCWIVIL